MTLRLYNTLTRKKEDFKPLDPANVRMYVCGPTVYDHAHIGNARPIIVFDVLFRLLRHLYGAEHVTYVRNITDVDDKINARAREEGVSIRDLTERTAKQFHADIAALGVLPPTVEPRATEHIAEMIAIIEMLIAKGHAYEASGHVLFDVPSMKSYGQLSRRSLDELIAGARVDVAPYKRGDMDFVLWKPSDADTPGWDSPWGRGRPGWHIECSAMSWKHLGETFDIHGGGIDLVFPHHENEVAQNLCAFGQNIMASIWMHNGFLQVESEKMSKSLGNFFTINELLTQNVFGRRSWIGPVLRLAMLKTHYRQPIDWTVHALEEAQNEFRSYAELVQNFAAMPSVDNEVLSHLSNDLNTPDVLMRTRELRDEARAGNVDSGRKLLGSLKLLGLFEYDFRVQFSVTVFDNLAGTYLEEAQRSLAKDYPVCLFADQFEKRDFTDNEIKGEILSALRKFTSSEVISHIPTKIDDLRRIYELDAARLAARKAKNWSESDRIRDELAKMGIAIKDNKDGTTSWEVKR